MPKLCLSQDPDADQLLSQNPLALLIGLVLDQQIPLERAFAAPLELQRRLTQPLTARLIADMDPGALTEAFTARPALHRFPASMAQRVQALCEVVLTAYDGNAEDLWRTAPSGHELLARVNALPGFGEQKARIFVAFVGKQLGVTPAGWMDASEPFGKPGTHQSIADIVDADSLDRVRLFKKAMKAAGKPEQTREAARSSSSKPAEHCQ